MSSRSTPDISWRAVAFGALVALAIAVPSAVISQQLDSTDRLDDDSALIYVFFAVIVAAMALGGGLAALRRPDAPMTHGALAALAAFTLVQTVGVIRRLVDGDDIAWVGIVFTAGLSATAGLVGGLVADRLVRRR